MKGERITAIVVAHTGEWSANGVHPSGTFSLSTYRRYASVEEFVNDGGRPVAPGTPVYRFDLAPRELVVHHAFVMPMADDRLPPRSMQRLLGKVEPWYPGAELKGLDYVSRDLHVHFAKESGIVVEEA